MNRRSSAASRVIEHEFTCPHCWQRISMLLEPGQDDAGRGSSGPGYSGQCYSGQCYSGQSEQSYIEDCEVCCNPIRITFSVVDAEVVSFDAQPIGQ